MSDSSEEDNELPEVRKAKREYYESIFKKYDKNGNGYMELRELRDMLKSDDEVPKKIVKKIFKVSDTNNDGKIDLDEFIGMVHNKNFKDLFGQYVNSYIRFIVPKQKNFVIGRRQRSSRDVDSPDGVYEEQCTCYPPPIAMFFISIFELLCFLLDEFMERDSTKYGAGVTADMFMYDPYKRHEFWRYLTYMFVHIGHFHLVVNLSVQILIGVPLEMVHKWWRVLLVYVAGVIAGSLITSITDPSSYLAGASGGVYSLITAHVASIIMNWREMSFPGCQLFIFILITGVDCGTSIYNRYALNINEHIGYAAHFGGALAGLLVGIAVLKNLEETRKERYIWWFAFTFYVLLMGSAIVLNIVWSEHFMEGS